MPITPEARQRLADLMDERRQELDKLWQDVGKDGGISLKALHTARTGASGIRPATRRKIEKGLRWERMSVDRVLAGEDPVPLQPSLVAVPDELGGGDVYDIVRRVLTDPLERLIWETTSLSEEERLKQINQLRAKKAELAAELAGDPERTAHGTALTQA